MNRQQDIQNRAEQIVDRIDTEISENAIEIAGCYCKRPPTNKDISKAIKDMNQAIIRALNQLNK